MRIAEGQGPWVPMHTGFAKFFPKGDRKHTELEAAFCVQLDYQTGNTVTVSGYAALWGWSRDKVAAFLKNNGVAIQYDEGTGRKQNQRGRLVFQQIPLQMSGRSSADNPQINFINNRCLPDEVSRSSADNQQNSSRSPGTTNKRLKKVEKREEKNPSPEALRLAGRLGELILRHTPGNTDLVPEKREATIKEWAADIEPLHTEDGQGWQRIEEIIEFSPEDTIERAIVLTGAQLRRRFNNLQTKLAVQEEKEHEARRKRDPLYGCGY